MMFREKGRRVLCLRSQYDPERKRTYARTVASLERGLSTVPEEVRQQIESEEVEQLEEWLSEQQRKRWVAESRLTLMLTPRTLWRASRSLDDEDVREVLDQEVAREMYRAMQALAKALRRAGFPRTRVMRQTPKKSD